MIRLIWDLSLILVAGVIIVFLIVLEFFIPSPRLNPVDRRDQLRRCND